MVGFVDRVEIRGGIEALEWATDKMRSLYERLKSMIMSREAEDISDALKIANGMERAQAVVISISSNGQAKRYGAMLPHTKYVVWGRVNDLVHIDCVDAAISIERGEEDNDESGEDENHEKRN